MAHEYGKVKAEAQPPPIRLMEKLTPRARITVLKTKAGAPATSTG
jgi:hypothetical protein